MTYEHQERYRRRTLLKAKYFDLMNEGRLRKLRWEARRFAAAEPEIRACMPYFFSHPEAVYLPVFCAQTDAHDKPYWYASTDSTDPGDRLFHAALAYVALKSVSILPRMVLEFTDGACGDIETCCPDLISRVERDLAGIRNAGMWVTE